jgi:uncharacterized protein YecE (DUF72 family)
MRPGKVRVGLSGWTYKSWRGRFYPEGLPHKRELAHIGSIFPTVEINGTFYSMQRPDAFGRWAELTPDDFVFSVKGPRFLTHMKRLNDPVAPLGNFVASGVLRLGRKLGPVLWQLPPNFHFNHDKLDAFFRLLPRDTHAAAACGRRHDQRLKARAWLRTGSRRQRLRHALEVRHKSFCDPAFIELLRRHDIALVCADTVEWPLLMDLTSDFVYCACTARVSSIAAATAPPSSAAGRSASGLGATARRCAMAPSSAHRRRPRRAMSTSISTTPTSLWRRATPGR